MFRSEAVGLDVTNLLSRIVHSSNSEGFEFHDLDVVRDFRVGLKNTFNTVTTKNVMGKSKALRDILGPTRVAMNEQMRAQRAVIQAA